MSIREQIKALEIRREQIKADLFDARAEQAEQIRRWNVEGVSTPLEDRLELQAEIADLEAERQSTKVAMMKLKQQLRLNNEKTYRDVVKEVILDWQGDIDGCVWLEEINKRYEEQIKE